MWPLKSLIGLSLRLDGGGMSGGKLKRDQSIKRKTRLCESKDHVLCYGSEYSRGGLVVCDCECHLNGACRVNPPWMK